jgi:hypothetical protein
VFFLLRAWGGADGDFDLLPEGVQEAEEPIEAVTLHTAADQGGHFGLGTLGLAGWRLRRKHAAK